MSPEVSILIRSNPDNPYKREYFISSRINNDDKTNYNAVWESTLDNALENAKRFINQVLRIADANEDFPVDNPGLGKPNRICYICYDHDGPKVNLRPFHANKYPFEKCKTLKQIETTIKKITSYNKLYNKSDEVILTWWKEDKKVISYVLKSNRVLEHTFRRGLFNNE